jgi:hypothetical protein
VFVAREQELVQLQRHLDLALTGQGRVLFVTGDAGSGKTALVQEFARRAQAAHPDTSIDRSIDPSIDSGQRSGQRSGRGLIFAGGHGNAQTGVGDPYLPFREILDLLVGDVEARWSAGAMTLEQARRLWSALPLTGRALVEEGPDLLDTFVGRASLQSRVAAFGLGPEPWLDRLAEGPRQVPAIAPAVTGPQPGDIFEQYTRVLQALARHAPLLLAVDDLQWADLGSISLLFHLGRQLAGSRILIVGAYRPEEIALGRPFDKLRAGPSTGLRRERKTLLAWRRPGSNLRATREQD